MTEIVEIKGNIITVKWTPNKLLKLFGFKEKTTTYLHRGETYIFGGGYVWYEKETGKMYGKCEYLDTALRKQNWN